MELSDKPTPHILVKANTNSEWDNCSFAIVHLSEDWQKEQAKRLELVKPLEDSSHFCSMNFYDTAVDFYGFDENDQPDVDEMLAGKEWVFVELGNEEQETFSVPENPLNCYTLVLKINGTAYYTAYGKHTGEEFWTEEFDLDTICTSLLEETELEKLCREQFKHLSNQQLVARANCLVDFDFDDEIVELRRRRRVSNGTFDYEIRDYIVVILRDEKQ